MHCMLMDLDSIVLFLLPLHLCLRRCVVLPSIVMARSRGHLYTLSVAQHSVLQPLQCASRRCGTLAVFSSQQSTKASLACCLKHCMTKLNVVTQSSAVHSIWSAHAPLPRVLRPTHATLPTCGRQPQCSSPHTCMHACMHPGRVAVRYCG
jgi:hypothetical protein